MLILVKVFAVLALVALAFVGGFAFAERKHRPKTAREIGVQIFEALNAGRPLKFTLQCHHGSGDRYEIQVFKMGVEDPVMFVWINRSWEAGQEIRLAVGPLVCRQFSASSEGVDLAIRAAIDYLLLLI